MTVPSVSAPLAQSNDGADGFSLCFRTGSFSPLSAAATRSLSSALRPETETPRRWQNSCDLHVFYLTTANGITQRLVENAEGARTYGVEGELRWLPTERWEFSGSIGWVDAKLTDVSNPFDGQRLAENRVPLAPEWNAGLSGQYVQPISDAINRRLRADLTYAGPYFFDTLNTQRQDGVALLNLSGALETEHVSFGIHVKNAFDEDYYRWRFNSGGRDFGAAAEPLSALAFIRSRF